MAKLTLQQLAKIAAEARRDAKFLRQSAGSPKGMSTYMPEWIEEAEQLEAIAKEAKKGILKRLRGD
ncbi:MAG: hypothetical protein ABID84_03590 [Chloroflexota bacterium]